MIHFCQGLKQHHILKQDKLDTSDLSLVKFMPEEELLILTFYPACTFVKSTYKFKYVPTNKTTNIIYILLVLGHVGGVWSTCMVVWCFWITVHMADYVDWNAYLHSLHGNIRLYQ